MNTKAWLGGLIAAISGGAGGAIPPAFLDPEHFANWHRMASLAGIGAALSILHYLRQSPLPGVTPQDPK